MGVQLNIKDAATVDLARELARELGKTVTETIRDALEEKRRVRNEEQTAWLARMNAFVAEIHAQLPDDVKAMTLKEIMDSIYDEDGLPG